jgi:hypothetical protein
MRLKVIVVEKAVAFDADSSTEFSARIATGGVGNFLR